MNTWNNANVLYILPLIIFLGIFIPYIGKYVIFLKNFGLEFAKLFLDSQYPEKFKLTLKQFFLTVAHCSYLDIYISRKIRLCVVDLEGQFQTSLQPKLINFFTWKFRSVILIFLLFFAGIVKYIAFYTLLLLFQRLEIFELWFDPNPLHTAWFFVKCKCPNSYSTLQCE